MTATDKGYIGIAMEGSIARWYARNTAKDWRRHQGLARRLAQNLPAGSRVLEIAPGPGYFCIELAKLGRFQITGLDISQTFVEIARQNAAAAGVDVDFRLGNASELPFEDNQFDRIVCQAAFKNFSQPVRAIAEMQRVLRPGGSAIILDLDRHASHDAIRQEINGMGLHGFNRIFTQWSLISLLKRAYTPQQMSAMVAQTPFHTCEITPEGIGFQVLMKKAAV